MYSTCLWVDFITLSYVIFLENKCLTVCPNKVSLQKGPANEPIVVIYNNWLVIKHTVVYYILHVQISGLIAQTINSLNLSIKTEPIAEGTDADVWFLNWIYTYCTVFKQKAVTCLVFGNSYYFWYSAHGSWGEDCEHWTTILPTGQWGLGGWGLGGGGWGEMVRGGGEGRAIY